MSTTVLSRVPMFSAMNRIPGGSMLVPLVLGSLVYLGYRYMLRRAVESGMGFAAGTTAGNAIATPAVPAAADPRFELYVGTATAQVAASVLVTAILAPILASFFLEGAGALGAGDDELDPISETAQEDPAVATAHRRGHMSAASGETRDRDGDRGSQL